MSSLICAICNRDVVTSQMMVAIDTSEGVALAHTACVEARSRAAHLARYPFECPQCKGAKQVATGFHEERSCCNGGPMNIGGFGAFAGCEYCPRQVTTRTPTGMKPCDLCNGVGRLEKEPTAVTKTVGWTR